MDDLKKELGSLRLDDQPPRSRRGAWVVIASRESRDHDGDRVEAYTIDGRTDMELIAANTRINAKPAWVLIALTTTDGFRHWWTDDAEVGRNIGAPAIFRFGTIEATFLIDRIDHHGIEMTCVDHKNYPEWLDTHLAFRVIPDGDGAYVDVLHNGYRAKNDCYARCVEGWTHYLKSLRAYCETGRGTPHLI